jgi:hypothetical protein
MLIPTTILITEIMQGHGLKDAIISVLFFLNSAIIPYGIAHARITFFYQNLFASPLVKRYIY